MFHASIPTQYWPEVFESVVFTINRLPSSSISFSTPYNKLFQKQPDYSFFKILDCLCYPYTRPYASNKFSPRSNPYVLLGYSHLYKGYKCLDLKTNKLYLSRHVVFDEGSFPFKSLPSNPASSSLSSLSSPLVILQQDYQTPFSTTPSEDSLSHPPTPPQFTPLSAPPVFKNPTPQITKVYERRSQLNFVPSTDLSTHHMQTR
jgi:hypothetical protein